MTYSFGSVRFLLLIFLNCLFFSEFDYWLYYILTFSALNRDLMSSAVSRLLVIFKISVENSVNPDQTTTLETV